MRLLQRPGQDVARRHGEKVPFVTGKRLLGEHPRHRVEGFLPHGPLGLASNAAEVNPSIRDQVQGRNPLGDPGRVVDRWRGLDDAVTKPDPPGALARGGEEHLRGGGVRVLLEEVMLDFPDVVEAGPVGELDLLERIGQQRVLGFRPPGPGQLVLVEDAEPHMVLLDRMPRPRGSFVLAAPTGPG